MRSLFFVFCFGVLALQGSASQIVVYAQPKEDSERKSDSDDSLSDPDESVKCSLCFTDYPPLESTDHKKFLPRGGENLKAPLSLLCKEEHSVQICYECANKLSPYRCPFCKGKLRALPVRLIPDDPYAKALAEPADKNIFFEPVQQLYKEKPYTARFFIVVTNYPLGSRTYRFFIERKDLPYPGHQEAFSSKNLPTLHDYDKVGFLLMKARWAPLFNRNIVDTKGRKLGTLHSNMWHTKYKATCLKKETVLKIKFANQDESGSRVATLSLFNRGNQFLNIINLASINSFDFRGRIDEESYSEENIIFQHPDNTENRLLQLSHLRELWLGYGEKIYAVDAAWPVSPFEAFCFAIARLEPYWKVAELPN